jgi:hypothetical protein
LIAFALNIALNHLVKIPSAQTLTAKKLPKILLEAKATKNSHSKEKII